MNSAPFFCCSGQHRNKRKSPSVHMKGAKAWSAIGYPDDASISGLRFLHFAGHAHWYPRLQSRLLPNIPDSSSDAMQAYFAASSRQKPRVPLPRADDNVETPSVGMSDGRSMAGTSLAGETKRPHEGTRQAKVPAPPLESGVSR